jgi:MFS family permease
MSAGKKMRTDWLDGLKVIRRNRIVMALFVLLGINNVIDGLVTVLLAVYVTTALGGGSPELGFLLTAQAVGGLAGGLFVGRITRNIPAWKVIGAGLILFGLLDALLFGIPILALNIVLIALAGIPIIALEVGAITLFQTVTEDRFRGRIFGIYGTVSGVLLLLGRGIATIIGGQVNVSLLMAVVSLIYIPTGLLAFRLLREPAKPAPSAEESLPASAQAVSGV